ncbi:hypothetical protein [Sphingomonas sp.]|uniref:hypothetical protein n=1 Tax=Sphingomonas sp. TaxID=28214 RepID=UPI003B3A62E6
MTDDLTFPEPEFEPVSTQVDLDGATYTVIVEANAIHALWGAGTGPQTGPEIVAQNMRIIAAMVAERVAEGPLSEPFVITDADLDM